MVEEAEQLLSPLPGARPPAAAHAHCAEELFPPKGRRVLRSPSSILPEEPPSSQCPALPRRGCRVPAALSFPGCSPSTPARLGVHPQSSVTPQPCGSNRQGDRKVAADPPARRPSDSLAKEVMKTTILWEADLKP